MPRKAAPLSDLAIEKMPLPKIGRIEKGTGFLSLFITVHSTGHRVFRYYCRLNGRRGIIVILKSPQ